MTSLPPSTLDGDVPDLGVYHLKFMGGQLSSLGRPMQPKDLPARLYRFLHQAEFADAFASGEIWLSTIAACRKHESTAQGDPGEGSVDLTLDCTQGENETERLAWVSGELERRLGSPFQRLTHQTDRITVSLPDAHLLCTTEHFNPALQSDFGNYCVEILDPFQFFSQITRQLNALMPINLAQLGRVIYRPRLVQGFDEGYWPPAFVKPAGPYASQKEFRMLWFSRETPTLRPGQFHFQGLHELCRRVA